MVPVGVGKRKDGETNSERKRRKRKVGLLDGEG